MHSRLQLGGHLCRLLLGCTQLLAGRRVLRLVGVQVCVQGRLGGLDGRQFLAQLVRLVLWEGAGGWRR